MSILYAIAGMTVIFCHFCRAQDTEHTIDLRGQGTLKNVFEAGLEPRKVRGLERSLCEVEDTSLRFLLDGGHTFYIDAKRLDILVYDNDSLGYLQAYTDYLTIDEAYKLADKLGQELGRPATGLKAFIEKLRSNPLAMAGGYGFCTNNQPRVNVFFLRGVSAERPLRLAIKVEWIRPPLERRPRTQEIKPPIGYEHLSMEPLSHAERENAPADSAHAQMPPRSAIKTMH
jgi:hypothetical protein